MDAWKRYGGSLTINGSTGSSALSELRKSSQIFDRHAIEQSIACYRLDSQILLVEFNRTQFLSTSAHPIYNLTVYDHQDHLALTDNPSLSHEISKHKHYNSYIYRLQRRSASYKIKFLFSIPQSNSPETVVKYCDDFHPTYSPLTCSIKSSAPNNHHLLINVHSYHIEKPIHTLKANNVFYRISRTHLIKKNIYEIPQVRFAMDEDLEAISRFWCTTFGLSFQYVSANIIDLKENYSVIVENNLLGSASNEKINISILCPITRTGLLNLEESRLVLIGCSLIPAALPRANVKRESRILGGIIVGLILSIISLTALAFFIAYRKYVEEKFFSVLLTASLHE